jgi:hypothetical protein
LDDCDPTPSPFPPTKFPPCIEIGDIAIIQILYDCADLLAGDPTTVIVNIQTQDGQQTQSLPLNGSDGTETNQSESFDFTITTPDDVVLLENILTTLLTDCFQQSEGSISADFSLQALIDQILALLAKQGGALYAQKIHYVMS